MLKERNGRWYVRIKGRDLAGGEMVVATGTELKSVAKQYDETVQRLYAEGRLDLLGRLRKQEVTLRQLQEARAKGGRSIEQLATDSPALRPLVTKWFAWLPTGLSSHTKRRLAASSIERYRDSWDILLTALPEDATLSSLTKGFFADYRANRMRWQGGNLKYKSANVGVTKTRPTGATVNRDLSAVGAFLRWCEEVEELTFQRVKIRKETESKGRIRWLSDVEIKKLRKATLETEPAWWPVFYTLITTGARVGELRVLKGKDVSFADHKVTLTVIKTGYKAETRIVGLPTALAPVLGETMVQVKTSERVFPIRSNQLVLHALQRACAAAEIEPARTHDLRHTWAVQAAMRGATLDDIMHQLGHATPDMAIRYMRTAGLNVVERANKAVVNLDGVGDREQDARAQVARADLKIV